MNRAPLCFCVVALATGLFASISRPADACSPPCPEASFVPGKGGAIPASAPGFPIKNATGLGPEVRDPAGAIVAGTVRTDPLGGTVFAPSAALSPGKYTVSLTPRCTGGGGLAWGFDVTPSVPLPTATGTLAVSHAAREQLSVGTSSGSCFEPVDAGYVDVALTADASMSAWMDVVAWETLVDGASWSRAEALGPTSFARGILRVFTPCDTTGTAGRDHGVSAGPHTIELRATVVGGAAIPAARVVTNVTCDARNGTPPSTPVTPDAGPVATGTPPPATTTPPGGTVTPPPATTSAPTAGNATSSGCTAAPAAAGGAAAFASLLLIAIPLLRRRRARA